MTASGGPSWCHIIIHERRTQLYDRPARDSESCHDNVSLFTLGQHGATCVVLDAADGYERAR